MSSRSCSSRASWPCRPTACRTGCGTQGRETLAFYLQSRASEIFQVDINPAAKIGKGVFIDHGTGIVIGETAVVGDNVSMLHGVTLGGTGADRGDRHPKIGNGVLLGAGAKVLGNITIGDYAKIASGSVVLRPVPPTARPPAFPPAWSTARPARSRPGPWTTPWPMWSTTT
jgi:serine O-acetyltransferase